MNIQNVKKLAENKLNNIRYYWLDSRNNEFDEISEGEFNKLQFIQDSFTGRKSIQCITKDSVFGCDGRYTEEYLIKKVNRHEEIIKE